MFGSINIARVFGVGVRLHWSLVVFIVVLLVTGYPFRPVIGEAAAALPYNLVFLSVVIAIVLLHELGHALVARRFGLQVLDVTLWPLGGFTRMSRIPEDSKIEGWIAFAGPAVNLALAAVALLFAPDGTLRDGPLGIQEASRFELAAGMFAWANLILALVNLLPAFPLDGGRLLRALIALRVDWLTATRRTVAVGKWIALATVVWGLYSWFEADGSVLLPLFGVFLWFSGVRESWSVSMRHVGADFARSMGVLVDPPIVEAESVDPAPTNVSDDPSGARRPSLLHPPGPARKERMSDEEIAALERFRGRMGREAP